MSRINILTAIRDHDQQGAGPFGEALGFEGLGEEVLVERGRRYDARALFAYAHGKATGEYLGPDEVTYAALTALVELGFTVASRTELDRPAPASRSRTPGTRTTTPRAVAPRKVARPEPVVAVCPSCFTQLSLAGSCDYCD